MTRSEMAHPPGRSSKTRAALVARLPFEQDGSPLEAERLAQTPLQVTYIIRPAISRIVHKQGECGRPGPGLSRVVELEVLPGSRGWRLDLSQDRVDHAIQLGSRDGARVLPVDLR